MPKEGDAAVAPFEQQLHAPPDAADVVGDDGVDVGADGGTVEAHDRGAGGDDRPEVRLVDRCRHDEQAP